MKDIFLPSLLLCIDKQHGVEIGVVFYYNENTSKNNDQNLNFGWITHITEHSVEY